ncbi:shikimate dehydrogenase family protein [Hoeflea sp.]|uniref:shikimate dehydrogenase family protein n=1 Tax=Hoeflea sp. TaxID=1940281 RepID=UPI0037491C8F
MASSTIRLGLIGDNIAQSQAPRLHRLAGLQNDRAVTYDRLVPHEQGKAFDPLFSDIADAGYRGVNITYPYKERASTKVIIEDDLVRAMGAVNTVVFAEGGPHGFNTDYSGFIRAYRRIWGVTEPGPVLMIGAGGVGKAIAFGLVALGLQDIRIADLDIPKAQGLASALRLACPHLHADVGSDAGGLSQGVNGIINCTPIGMDGYPGTPLDRRFMAGASWAFDAVYTPLNTVFLEDARKQGLQTISGYELFIGQGLDAWRIFTGLPLDEDRLRADLLNLSK